MTPAVELEAVTVRRRGSTLVRDVSLVVPTGRAMALLGPNGAGKTTLLRLMAARLFPTSGRVAVLGTVFGRSDLRSLRGRIGFASVALEPLLPATQPVLALVAAARQGGLRLDPHRVADEDLEAAAHALGRIGVAALGDRRVATCSQGEWQRVQIARALVSDPELLLLDEPFAGLDLGAREQLVGDLDRLLAGPDAPTTVVVSHHLEELPTRTATATLVRDGTVVATGAIDEVITDEAVGEAFGVRVVVDRRDGRLAARHVP